MKLSLVFVTLFSMASAVWAQPIDSFVKTLPSGVIVKTVTPGSGHHPKATDMVQVQYRGTLADGTVFDDSARHGGAVEFPLNQVIACWTQGLQQARVGARVELTCPAATAYGASGAGNLVPANAELTFDIELLGARAP